MAGFRVTFMKTLYNDTGHQFQCCQRVVEVEASDRDSATEIAMRRFCDLEKVVDWRTHADWFEVDEPTLAV